MLRCATRRARVLAVDNSPAFLCTLSSFFENDPNIDLVATATSGQEALAAVAELRPDLVLMDLQMPGMNGLQATEELSRRFPDIPVVVLTAYDMPRLQQVCKESGAREVATKGRLSQELPAVLASILGPLRTKRDQEPKTETKSPDPKSN